MRYLGIATFFAFSNKRKFNLLISYVIVSGYSRSLKTRAVLTQIGANCLTSVANGVLSCWETVVDFTFWISLKTQSEIWTESKVVH